ncbi:MAG: hypothetical protein K6E51_11920 [Treponema sp.]|nr:hypothetical protein [Treponema sp.]
MDSDKTNELDSYGVWVKKPVNESTPDSNADESFGITPDLPDFSSLDDIQEASPSLPQSAPINDSFVSDDEGDTSLSMEELSNLTTNTEIVDEENTDLPSEMDMDIDVPKSDVSETDADITEPALENTELETEAPLSEEPLEEESLETVDEIQAPTTDELADSVINTPDIEDPFAGLDLDATEPLPLDIASLDETTSNDSTDSAEESIDTNTEASIVKPSVDNALENISEESLDAISKDTLDTLSEDSLDVISEVTLSEEPLPSNSEAETEDPFATTPEQTDTEPTTESTLDDFSFDDIPVETKVAEEDDPFAEYEEKADNSLSVTSLDEDFPDPVAAPETTSESDDFTPLESVDDFNSDTPQANNDEEVSLDDFFNEELELPEEPEDEPLAEPIVNTSEEPNTDTISEPVVTDSEEHISEPITEPLANDINDTFSETVPDTFEQETAIFTEPDSEETTTENNGVVEPIIAEDSFSADTSPDSEATILQQIQKELSSLRDEISVLKSDLAALKTATPVTTEENADVVTEQNSEPEDTGFFGDTGDDDLIALSGDEMSHILNNSEFAATEESASEPELDEINLTPEEADEVTQPESSDTSDILVESASEDLFNSESSEPISEQHLDYISSEEPIESEDSASEVTQGLSPDLTNDIKSVLSYMDKLLENLPDDKIKEFAQSEQFTVYKNLFTELGLA